MNEYTFPRLTCLLHDTQRYDLSVYIRPDEHAGAPVWPTCDAGVPVGIYSGCSVVSLFLYLDFHRPQCGHSLCAAPSSTLERRENAVQPMAALGGRGVSEWTKQLAAAQGHRTALIWCHISSETDTSWHLGLGLNRSASLSPPDLWLIIHTQVTPPSRTSTPKPPCCHVLCSRSLKWKPRFEISGVRWGSKHGSGSRLMACEC